MFTEAHIDALFDTLCDVAREYARAVDEDRLPSGDALEKSKAQLAERLKAADDATETERAKRYYKLAIDVFGRPDQQDQEEG